MRVPEYLTTEEITVHLGSNQTKVLPTNSFVKPIEFTYLPKHIQESDTAKYYNKKTSMFCYTHWGIVLIDKSKVREV